MCCAFWCGDYILPERVRQHTFFFSGRVNTTPRFCKDITKELWSPSVRLSCKTTNTYRIWTSRGFFTDPHIYIDAARGTFCVSTRQAIELDLSQLLTCNHYREATRKGWGRRAGQHPTYHLTRGLQVGVQFRRDTPNRLEDGSFSRRISVETRNNLTLFIWVETIFCSEI